MPFEPDVGSRGLRDHLGVLRRRAPIIVVIALCAVLAALVLSILQPRRYTASADVLFQQEVTTVADPRPDQIVDSKRLDPIRVMQNEMHVARSDQVRTKAREIADVKATVSVSNPRDTDILVFSASASKADAAARAANAHADAYVQVTKELSGSKASAASGAIADQLVEIDARVAALDAELAAGTTSPERTAAITAERDALVDQRADWVRQQATLDADASLESTNEAQIVEQASPPSDPSQPAILRNAVLALVLGLVVALLVAYAIDHLDDVIRTTDDLGRSLSLPVLGALPTTGEPSEIHAVPVGDPRVQVAGLAALDPSTTSMPEGAHVLGVPRGSRAHDVQASATALERLGVNLVGSVLLVAEPDEP